MDPLTPLPPSRYQAYLSPYLREGYQQEQSTLDQVWIGPSRVEAQITIHNPTEDAEGGFHLSFMTASAWVQQLVIVHGCWHAGLARKIGEAYLRDFSIHCQRAIQRERQVPCVLEVPSIKRVKTFVVYKNAVFNVGEGAFRGSISGYVSTRTA